MPKDARVPPGTLMMLVLRVLARQPLHGYAIAQRIHQISAEALHVEEGALYPALQKLVIKGWVTSTWRESESGRQVREYRITTSGRRQLATEMTQYRRTARAIDWLLDKA